MTTQDFHFNLPFRRTCFGSNSYLTKLPQCLIEYIQSFLDLREQCSTFEASSGFQRASSLLSSLNQTSSRDSIKYLLSLLQLETDIGDYFSPNLNVFMSINLITLLPKWSSSIQLRDQVRALSAFLTYRYDKTHERTFEIILSDMDTYHLYYSVLSELPFCRELKVNLTISPFLKHNLNEVLPLFSIITPRQFNWKTEILYAQIQQQLIKKKIEAYHYKIFFSAKSLDKELIEYFQRYPNHLFTVTSSEYSQLAQYNQSSITTITGAFPYELSSSCKSLSIRKFKSCGTKEGMLEMFSHITDFSNVSTFGGFQVLDKEQCDQYLSIINSMSKLRSLSSIQFGEEDREYELFDYFFNNLSRERKQNIKKIKLWYYSIREDKDFDYFEKEFPHLQTLIIRNDDDLMDFGIDGVYCNCVEVYSEWAEMRFITYLLKNKMNNSAIGKKCFKISVIGDMAIPAQFFNYLHDHEKDMLLNSIEREMIGNYKEECPFPPIKQMNMLYLLQDDDFIQTFKPIERIIEITIYNRRIFKEYYDFIKERRPLALVYVGKNALSIIKEIEAIPSVKYLVVSYSEFRKMESEYAIKTIRLSYR